MRYHELLENFLCSPLLLYQWDANDHLCISALLSYNLLSNPPLTFVQLNDFSLLQLCNHIPRQPLSFLSIDLPFLEISHKWNHIIGILLYLVSFTECNVFKAHPCTACVSASLFLWLNNILLSGWTTFTYPFLSQWTSWGVSIWSL